MPLLAFVFIIVFSLTSPVSAWCIADSLPQINVIPKTDTIRYDLTKTKNVLNTFEIDTESPYAPHVHADVGGLMEGEIKSSFNLEFKTLENPNTNETCLWIHQINVELNISPTIYIASEYPQGTCMYNAILEHEMKHVYVDRQIVNKYARYIGKALQKEMKRKYFYDPVPNENLQALQDNITETMSGIITNQTNIMAKDRSARQQAVDNIEEYERVSAMCPEQRRQIQRARQTIRSNSTNAYQY